MESNIINDLRNRFKIYKSDEPCEICGQLTCKKQDGVTIQPCFQCYTRQRDTELHHDMLERQSSAYQMLLDDYKSDADRSKTSKDSFGATLIKFIDNFFVGQKLMICGGNQKKRSVYKNILLNELCGDHRYKISGATGYRIYQKLFDDMHEKKPIGNIQKNIMKNDIYVISKFGKHSLPISYRDMLQNIVDVYRGSLFIFSAYSSQWILSQLDSEIDDWTVIEHEGQGRGGW